MYTDSVFQWNVFVGCNFDCIYCKKSFQAQMKRQKHNCAQCAAYYPHFHPERLDMKLPGTKGDQFIWPCSSGDIAFAKAEWMERILEKVHFHSDKTFLFQSKRPSVFWSYNFPDNVILGTTIETNRIKYYNDKISTAPNPKERIRQFKRIKHWQKSITVEPILCFDVKELTELIREIAPARVYIGYDSKQCGLPEPSLRKTKRLMKNLAEFTDVKPKLLRRRQYCAKEFSIMLQGQKKLSQFIPPEATK